tara:strand:+ start:353 stop:574 length:222 start_codon:yes stop_codon:yes gene_type:complete
MSQIREILLPFETRLHRGKDFLKFSNYRPFHFTRITLAFAVEGTIVDGLTKSLIMEEGLEQAIHIAGCPKILK